MTKTRIFRAAILAALCGPAAPAWADGPAVLKLRVELDAGVIKVADIWSNAGTKAETVVGPAPPPGRAIAVEAAQLAYIAKLFDVDWRPVSGAERAAIERLGRPLTRDEVIDPIRRGLIDAGAPANTSVDLADFSPVDVPPMAFPTVTVEGLSYDQAAERFTANLAASCDGMETRRLRVAGRVVQMVAAVVANRRLQPGEVIAAADVRAAQVPERRLATPVLGETALAIGQSPKRVIVAGQPLAAADIGPPMLVAKGDTVVMVVDTPSMYLAVQGLALGEGGRGDIVQVMNPLSRAVVAARVTGPGRAVIAAAGAPAGSPSRVEMSDE